MVFLMFLRCKFEVEKQRAFMIYNFHLCESEIKPQALFKRNYSIYSSYDIVNRKYILKFSYFYLYQDKPHLIVFESCSTNVLVGLGIVYIFI